mgnify:FL=1
MHPVLPGHEAEGWLAVTVMGLVGTGARAAHAADPGFTAFVRTTRRQCHACGEKVCIARDGDGSRSDGLSHRWLLRRWVDPPPSCLQALEFTTPPNILGQGKLVRPVHR